MTAVLRVVLDPTLDSVEHEGGRYALELAREIIASAPGGIEVEAIVPASSAAEYELLERRLPGLAQVHKSAFDKGTVRALWRRGVGVGAHGMVHAFDLMAPLTNGGRRLGDARQTAVTIHDSLAWTAPGQLPRHEVSWRRSMISRAERYADAIIVPNHEVADDLEGIGRFGDRIHVIPGGTHLESTPPLDAAERARALGLPDRFLLAIGTGSARRTLLPLLRGLSRTDGPRIPLILVGWADVEQACVEAGLDLSRVMALRSLDGDDYSTVLHYASVFVHPGPAEGFGLPLLDAMAVGVPVVHADDAALEELTAGAALVVSRRDVIGFTASLAQHLDALLDDAQTLERMRFSGRDRARFFSWREAAEKVWQLHADL